MKSHTSFVSHFGMLAGVLVLMVALIIPFTGNHVTRVQAAPGTEIYLKIDGIAGDSTDKDHKDEFIMSSYSFGATNSGSSSMGGGMGAGKVSMSDFTFTSGTGKASPKLFEAVASGKHIPKATLTVRKAGSDVVVWNLEDIMVTSYKATASTTDTPTDQFSLNFTKIQVEYKGSSSGSSDASKAGWDVKANKKI